MSKRYIVGVDENPSESRALAFAKTLVADNPEATLRIIHVLAWSPYSFLTPEELGERQKRREGELKRATDVIIKPALDNLRADNINAVGEVRYGNIAETIAKYTEEVSGDLIIINRSGEGRVSARLFGSVPNALVQTAPVPVVVVP